MTSRQSMLSAVHAAVHGTGEDENDERKGSSAMSDDKQKPKVEVTAPDAQASAETARTEGRAEGYAAGVADVAAALSAEGIAGHPGRMNAAVECLAEGMSVEKATAFATKHVAEAKAEAGKPDSALDRRQDKPDSLAAAGLSEPKKSGLKALAEARYAKDNQ